MQQMISTWEMLRKPIYVGDRLEGNLRILTIVSFVTALLGIILTVINIIVWKPVMIFASAITFLAGAICAYFAGVKKDRNLATMVPLIFCAVAFTLYAFTGAGEGFSMLSP